jgi:HEAT repeat protein
MNEENSIDYNSNTQADVVTEIASMGQASEMLSWSDPDARRHAVEYIALNGDIQAITALVQACGDSNKGVRDAVVNALSSFGTTVVAEAIVPYIAHDDISVRNLAAGVLLRLGGAAVQALLPFLNHANHDVRKFAVDLIGNAGDWSVTPNLFPLLDDSDENVVVSVCEALGNLGDPRAVSALRSTFREKSYARVCAAEAIGKIRDQNQSPFFVDALREAFSETEPDLLLQYALIEGLGSVGDPDALEYLLDKTHTISKPLASAALESAFQIAARWQQPLPESDTMKSALIEALRSPNPSVKHSAVKALAEYPTPDVTRALILAMGSSHVMDTMPLAILLDRVDAFPIALSLIASGMQPLRKSVIVLVGELAKQLSVEDRDSMSKAIAGATGVLVKAWNDAEQETRSAIVNALFCLDEERAVQFLDELLNEPDPWGRVEILELLAATPHLPVFLPRFLKDECDIVRNVARALTAREPYDGPEAEI